MKKYIVIAAAVAAVVAICTILSFFITLARYAADKPVAEVDVIKICQERGGESHWGGYFAGDQFANVQILKIHNSAKFKKVALKISKDGERANLRFADGYSHSDPQKCYASDSLRGGQLAGWWHNFGHYWNRTASLLSIIFLILGWVFILAIGSMEQR